MADRVQTVDRLQALLAELPPGQASRDITTGQAKAMFASVAPATSLGGPADASPPKSSPIVLARTPPDHGTDNSGYGVR